MTAEVIHGNEASEVTTNGLHCPEMKQEEASKVPQRSFLKRYGACATLKTFLKIPVRYSFGSSSGQGPH